MKILNFVGKR